MSETGVESQTFIGRKKELHELRTALRRATTLGAPQAISIIGASGIGKSRLVDAFLNEVMSEEPDVRIFRSAARESGPTFAVLANLLRQRMQLDSVAEEDRDARFRDEVSLLLGDARVTEVLHFLGLFLGFGFAESPFLGAFQDAPGQTRVIAQSVLRHFWEVDAQQSPIVLVLEDLHWTSEDALLTIANLAQSLQNAPIVVVMTMRPDFWSRRDGWLNEVDHHRLLELAPLSEQEGAELAKAILSPADASLDELIESVVELAGGSPYLINQSVRSYIEHRVAYREQDMWHADLDLLESTSLPLTMEDAIRARISTLAGAERVLLERAASMGGVFWLGALVALGREDSQAPDLWGGHSSREAHYREILEDLAERDFILPLPDSSIQGEREYAFKHNLEREALHSLSHHKTMAGFHRVVAEWLEFRLADRGEDQLELLAFHYEKSGEQSAAGRYYIAAGDRARGRFANSKAAEFYQQGLLLLGKDDIRLQMNALHHYGAVLQLVGRNEEALSAFRQMLALSYRLDLKAKGGAAHNRIGRLHRSIGKLDEAMRHLGTAQALFEAVNDQRGVASTLDDVGKVHWMRGNFSAAENFLNRALEMRRSFGDKRSLALSLNNVGIVCQDSGRFSEALSSFNEALAIRRDIGDHSGIAQTLNNLGTIHGDNGDHQKAVEMYEAALEHVRLAGDRMREAVVLTNLGESHYRLQRPEKAIEVLKRAAEISSTLGDRILEGEVLRGLAKAHMLVGDLGQAKRDIDASVTSFENARSMAFLGIALRTSGEIALAANEEREVVEGHYQRAMKIFDDLGHEVEIAVTCEIFANYLSAQDNETDAKRAIELREKAKEVRSRQQLERSWSDDSSD